MTYEERRKKYLDQSFKCFHCGQIREMHLLQAAHRIPRKKAYLKKYGSEVMDHPLNIRLTCPGNCNDAVLMDFAAHPIAAQKLIDQIQSDLYGG